MEWQAKVTIVFVGHLHKPACAFVPFSVNSATFQRPYNRHVTSARFARIAFCLEHLDLWWTAGLFQQDLFLAHHQSMITGTG